MQDVRTLACDFVWGGGGGRLHPGSPAWLSGAGGALAESPLARCARPAVFCPQLVLSAMVGLRAGNVLLCSLPEDPRRLFAKVGECAPAPETCVRMARRQLCEARVPALGGMHGWHHLRWHLLRLQDILLPRGGAGLVVARN